MARLRPKADSIHEKQRMLESTLATLQEGLEGIATNSTVIQNDVRKKIVELHTLLNEREAELIQRVKDIQEAKTAELAAQVAKVNEALTSVAQTAALADAAMEEGDAYAWLSNSGSLEARVESTLAQPLDALRASTTDFGCDLNVDMEADCLRVMDFQGPTMMGSRCGRPLLAEKRAGVVLNWDPPLMPPQEHGAWQQYVLEQKAEEDDTYQRVYRGALPSCELPTLPSGGFHFRVFALAPGVKSEFSDVLEYRTRNHPRSPREYYLSSAVGSANPGVTVVGASVERSVVASPPPASIVSTAYPSAITHNGSPVAVYPASSSKILDFSAPNGDVYRRSSPVRSSPAQGNPAIMC